VIIDTSAVVAVLKREPLHELIYEYMANAIHARMSAVTYFEAYQVVEGGRHGIDPAALDALLIAAQMEIVPFSLAHARIAREAFITYGKGQHPQHPKARLNLGDCCSYALAKASAEPILYIGGDFSHTDLVPVIPLDILARDSI